MSLRSVPFAPDEWYHCYSRGVEKRKIFMTIADYERFLQGLYLANSKDAMHRNNLRSRKTSEILAARRGKPLVAIGAYCLMPNHFHLLLKERTQEGISEFMQKLGTAYSMYFNIKYERTGNLFVKPFRSKHVADDRYFRHVAQYIHLNAAELFESDWKRGEVLDPNRLEGKLKAYRYSSFPDYQGEERTEKSILDGEEFNFIGSDMPSAKTILHEAQEYYQEMIDDG